ncbi:MAG TPA: UPF0280 family protein [Burkholderiaceae bacterium]|nr:UPF0280 family protein [Burkholderiaceae bacterium]
MTAQRALLSGDRQHFAHGPIDLVIGAEGERAAVAAAHEAAWQRFVDVLPELVGELALLRQPVGEHCALQGRVARRMWLACHPYRAAYITPMAAVAGAVAQEIIAAYERPGVSRAWVNNGGDIALRLAPGASVRVGLVADLARMPKAAHGSGLGLDGNFTVAQDMPVRGIATSGWRGRSFSLGIADSVTVLAGTAAQADAAATVIANAVNVDDPRIVRQPACELKDDTDLGRLLVTIDVPALEESTVNTALARGVARARELQDCGLIWEAALVCQGHLATTAQADPLHMPAPHMVRELLDSLTVHAAVAGRMTQRTHT